MQLHVQVVQVLAFGERDLLTLVGVENGKPFDPHDAHSCSISHCNEIASHTFNTRTAFALVYNAMRELMVHAFCSNGSWSAGCDSLREPQSRWGTRYQYSIARVQASDETASCDRRLAMAIFRQACSEERELCVADELLAESFRRRCGIGHVQSRGWLYPQGRVELAVAQ